MISAVRSFVETYSLIVGTCSVALTQRHRVTLRVPSPKKISWGGFRSLEITRRIRYNQICLGLLSGVKVGEVDLAHPLDVDSTTSIFIDDSSYVRRHQSQSITDGNTTLPNQPLRASGKQIVVDTAQPTVTGVYGLNGNGEWAVPAAAGAAAAARSPSLLPLRCLDTLHNVVVACSSLTPGAGPFGFNDEVEICINFSLPIAVPKVETTEYPPKLLVVVGSTSTARTSTYLTADAVLTAEDARGSTPCGEQGLNKSSATFKYLVATDDKSIDLRRVNCRFC